MVKKISMVVIIFAMLVGMLTIFSCSAYAVTGEEVLNSTQATELVEIKETTKGKLAEYIEKYGSTPFGVAAYVLNVVRIYSIPFCFVGIALGSIFQYVLGIRKLDVRDRGFMLIITSLFFVLIVIYAFFRI